MMNIPMNATTLLFRACAVAVAGVLFGLAPGCGTPPSVQPLLTLSQQVMLEEAGRVSLDRQRDEQRVQQSLETLEAAFAADLRLQGAIESGWVLSAVRGYTAAREAVVRHQLEMRSERERREASLRQAAALNGRAVRILQQRDALVDRLGPNTAVQTMTRLLGDPASP